MLGEVFSHLHICRILGRLPGTKAVNVAVVHAESRGNEDGVVDLDVGGPVRPRLGDIIGRDPLAVLLNLARDRGQRLELRA